MNKHIITAIIAVTIAFSSSAKDASTIAILDVLEQPHIQYESKLREYFVENYSFSGDGARWVMYKVDNCILDVIDSKTMTDPRGGTVRSLNGQACTALAEVLGVQ